MSKEKSGLEKTAIVLGTVFLVSLGLCGVNFVAAKGEVMHGDGGLLIATAYLELFGMVVSGAGLLVVALIAIARAMIDSFSSRGSDTVSIIEKDKEEQ
jgi:hypothetical protein